MRYLLDTNIFIMVMNERSSAVDDRLLRHRAAVALSSVVLHELYVGAFSSDRIERNLQRIAALDLPVLDFDCDDARAAGKLRAELRGVGRPIGPLDTLIAGQALARDLTLVTNNTREFERVQALRLEDWTAA